MRKTILTGLTTVIAVAAVAGPAYAQAPAPPVAPAIPVTPSNAAGEPDHADCRRSSSRHSPRPPRRCTSAPSP